jgi:hypothetical protein
MGRVCPIIPVEDTIIPSASGKAVLISFTVSCTSFSPCFPVHALAFPLLTIKCETGKPDSRTDRHRAMQGAQNLLVVKTPKTRDQEDETRIPKSSLLSGFIPAEIPQAENPRGKSIF